MKMIDPNVGVFISSRHRADMQVIVKDQLGLSVCPATFFVLFPRSTGAGIVASNLGRHLQWRRYANEPRANTFYNEIAAREARKVIWVPQFKHRPQLL